MKATRDYTSLLVIPFLVSFLIACADRNQEPTPPEQARRPQKLRASPEFRPVKGAEETMREAVLFRDNLPETPAILEIRDINVRPNVDAVLPLPQDTVLELVSGDLVTVTEGAKQVRQQGEIWLVLKGSRVTLRVSTELAVLRAIYLTARSR